MNSESKQLAHKAKMGAIWLSLVISIVLTIIKFWAYFLTHSTAILTDALESIVNIIASAFALFSLNYANKHKDEDHPYGHGKMEYFSAGFEGGLILIAGVLIIYHASIHLIQGHRVSAIDSGILFTSITTVILFILAWYVGKIGKQHHSLAVQAEGKHFLSDAVTNIGLMISFILIRFTGQHWIDSVIAIIYSLYIIYMGYQLIREAMDGLLDKMDFETVEQIVVVLNENRRIDWIDIHNMRLQKFGDSWHVDCHVTLPYYKDLASTHEEMENIASVLNKNFHNRVEFFIHPDPCKPSACCICQIENCQKRSEAFKEKITWKMENILKNQAHRLEA